MGTASRLWRDVALTWSMHSKTKQGGDKLRPYANKKRKLKRRNKMDETKQIIIDYIKKEFLEEDSDMEIKENTPLISSGIVDSFSMVSLKTFLERKYKIQIPDAKATPEAFDTVNNIIVLLKEYVKI
jgi:acyl carrier protein/D-alanine--poly(phosphoribitol) ligase subunit 2